MLIIFTALLGLVECLAGTIFGALSVAGIYITAEFWQKREEWLLRLGMPLFTCALALIAAALWFDAIRHLGVVIDAFL